MYYGEMMQEKLGQEDGLSIETLRGLLEWRGMTPADLARETGIHKSTISLLLSGKHRSTSVDNLVRIARALNVTPNYLMGFTEPDEPTPIQLGEMLLKLAQVASQLSARRQRELLAIAEMYLNDDGQVNDTVRDNAALNELLDILEEVGDEELRNTVLTRVKRGLPPDRGSLGLAQQGDEVAGE